MSCSPLLENQNSTLKVHKYLILQRKVWLSRWGIRPTHDLKHFTATLPCKSHQWQKPSCILKRFVTFLTPESNFSCGRLSQRYVPTNLYRCGLKGWHGVPLHFCFPSKVWCQDKLETVSFRDPTPLYLERGESCVYILIQKAPQPTKTEMAKALEASPRQRPSCALFSTRVPGAAGRAWLFGPDMLGSQILVNMAPVLRSMEIWAASGGLTQHRQCGLHVREIYLPFIYKYLLPALSQAGIRVHVPENTRAALSLHHLWGISWVSLETRLEGPVTKFRTSYLGKSPSSYPLTCDSTLLMSHFSHTASTFRSKLSPVFSLLYKTQTSFIPGYQHTHTHIHHKRTQLFQECDKIFEFF